MHQEVTYKGQRYRIYWDYDSLPLCCGILEMGQPTLEKYVEGRSGLWGDEDYSFEPVDERSAIYRNLELREQLFQLTAEYDFRHLVVMTDRINHNNKPYSVKEFITWILRAPKRGAVIQGPVGIGNGDSAVQPYIWTPPSVAPRSASTIGILRRKTAGRQAHV